jgi:uncharacterized protein YeaO (DUF488 family)
MIKIKNIQEPARNEDGFRIMVEEICVEDLDSKKSEFNLLLKEIAPSSNCYAFLNKNNLNFDRFREHYRSELKNKKTLQSIIRNLEKENGTITLLYCSGDPVNNCAAVLKEKLQGYHVIRGSVGRIHGG